MWKIYFICCLSLCKLICKPFCFWNQNPEKKHPWRSSWFTKSSSKFLRLMLAILQKIKLPHRTNLKIPSLQNSHPIKYLDAYFESIAWNVCIGGFTTHSYIQDSTFCKTRQRLKFNYLRENLITRRLAGFLMRPLLYRCNLHKISCGRSRVINNYKTALI